MSNAHLVRGDGLLVVGHDECCSSEGSSSSGNETSDSKGAEEWQQLWRHASVLYIGLKQCLGKIIVIGVARQARQESMMTYRVT